MSKPYPSRTEIRDGMRIDWDVPISMNDGIVLRADVFRPTAEGHYPVLLTYGPYAKGLAFQEGYAKIWEILARDHPDVTADSTNKYQNWEVCDPEKWVPEGYVCVRIDSRGAGRSPGFIEHFSPREARDYYDCIEWAGVQSWSNGKVGLSGVSYYAMNQWQVASLQPPHLAAMCMWEGAADWYRDSTHHGGIKSTFWDVWYPVQVKTIQYGLGERGYRSKVHGDLVSGPETLPEEVLVQNRAEFGELILAHPFYDRYFEDRAPKWDKITVPFLSAANWGGQGLHLRGNVEGFVRSASRKKWLECHGLEHWTHYYTDYGRKLQLEFFDHFLKGKNNGWEARPPVLLQVRHVDKFVERTETEWPITRTRWPKFYLNPEDMSLGPTPANTTKSVEFDALGKGLTFLTSPLSEETEITGPSAAKLRVSSSTTDADLFLVLRVFDPAGKEVLFSGAVDPHTPISQGWLRASHRKLEPSLSLPYRPYHSHDERWPLVPCMPVDLDIEIWPTSIVVPAGYRIGMTILGRDYEWDGPGVKVGNYAKPWCGCGPFVHDDPRDRPPEIYGGKTTLHFDGNKNPHVLCPIVPKA
jgi:predicted acyl esterase